MSTVRSHRRHVIFIFGALLLAMAGAFMARVHHSREENIDVYPGEDIQTALEDVARRTGRGTVRVHAGTYRPAAPGQALVFFNARHDGITLEAVGTVILTAANPAIADPQSPSYPAVVNHVVYFGDGISRSTKFRGFKVTGANGYVSGPKDLVKVRNHRELLESVKYSDRQASPIESSKRLERKLYFYTDGGGILIHGKSYPTIEGVEVYGNYSSICGGGVSVQHRPGDFSGSVLFDSCVFRDNIAAVSGSGVDILTPGSWASFENCLFVGNLSSADIDSKDEHGHGALTVFPGCRATVNQCTFASNRNGVNDLGIGSTYRNSIFWRNNREGGVASRERFELVLSPSATVSGCLISNPSNPLDPPEPDFDTSYRPRHRAYARVGWQMPLTSPTGPRETKPTPGIQRHATRKFLNPGHALSTAGKEKERGG